VVVFLRNSALAPLRLETAFTNGNESATATGSLTRQELGATALPKVNDRETLIGADPHSSPRISVRAALDGCRFLRLADLDADRVANWRAAQRDAGRGVTTSNGYVTAVRSSGTSLRWHLATGAHNERFARLAAQLNCAAKRGY
jgi:hypothetical protein